jgi:hypothetical protein
MAPPPDHIFFLAAMVRAPRWFDEIVGAPEQFLKKTKKTGFQFAVFRAPRTMFHFLANCLVIRPRL